MAHSAKPLPPLAELQQRYSYCPDSGELRFREHKWRRKVGALAGTRHADKNTSYLRVNHKGRLILVHRICFYLATGEEPANVIDHINGNGLDNRLVNLRDVRQADNCRNKNSAIKSPSGVRGVFWHKSSSQWKAKIGAKTLGYGDLLHCAALRKSAEQRLGYL